MNCTHVLKVRCNWCSLEREHNRTHTLQSNQIICDYCFEWHCHAQQVLSGAVPKGCQECGATWATLMALPGLAVRMFVVPKDGILQMLCENCIQLYTAKRADLYGGTAYGSNILKI